MKVKHLNFGPADPHTCRKLPLKSHIYNPIDFTASLIIINYFHEYVGNLDIFKISYLRFVGESWSNVIKYGSNDPSHEVLCIPIF